MRNLATAVAIAALTLIAAAAHATQVVALALSELRARADVVVHARVVEQRVVDVRLEHGARTATLTTLLELDADKGARAGDRLVVYQPGALDGAHVRWVDGAHRFKTGDEVVLFAKRFAPAGLASHDVVVAMAPGVGVFTVMPPSPLSPARVVEDGGVVDAATGAVVAPRAFASIAALYEAARAPTLQQGAVSP